MKELVALLQVSTCRLPVISRSSAQDVRRKFASFPQILIKDNEDDIKQFVLEQISKYEEWEEPLGISFKDEIMSKVTEASDGMFVLRMYIVSA